MNTLESINIRIIEAKEWISDLEVRIVESTTAEQNIEKRMEKNEDSLRPLGQQQMHQRLHYRDPRRRREKGPEKMF